MAIEERVTTLEKQMESLSAVLHQFVKTLSEIRENQSNVGERLASLFRTIYDDRNITKAGLVESSILNQLDKLNHYLQSSIKSGIIEPSNGAVLANSLVVGQQFNEQHEETNRRVLLNVSGMKPEDKAIFEGKTSGQEVTGFSEAPTAFILIHEIYQPVEKVEKQL